MEEKTTWNDANKVVSELVQDVQRQSKKMVRRFPDYIVRSCRNQCGVDICV